MPANRIRDVFMTSKAFAPPIAVRASMKLFTRMLPDGTRTLYAFIFLVRTPCSIKRQLGIDIFGAVTRRLNDCGLSEWKPNHCRRSRLMALELFIGESGKAGRFWS